MERCSKPIVVVLVGPTGVGKSEIAVALAQVWQCPILNADSRQIYRDLPIGTAAPTKEQQAQVKHYFVGTKDLTEEYNAGDFERDAVAILEKECQQPRPIAAILTGGSMLYIDAVCKGLDDIPSVPAAIRAEVQAGYRTGGLSWLQEQVQQLDPVYWEQVDQLNPQRLMHCIEVSKVLGRPFSTCRKDCHKERPWQVVKIGLTRPRAELYDRINRRVETMVEQGLEEEARKAEGRKGGEVPNSLMTVGYREWREYEPEKAIEMIKQNTRHYAKRQMTWWNRDKQIHWFEYETYPTTLAAISDYVAGLQKSNG